MLVITCTTYVLFSNNLSPFKDGFHRDFLKEIQQQNYTYYWCENNHRHEVNVVTIYLLTNTRVTIKLYLIQQYLKIF